MSLHPCPNWHPDVILYFYEGVRYSLGSCRTGVEQELNETAGISSVSPTQRRPLRPRAPPFLTALLLLLSLFLTTRARNATEPLLHLPIRASILPHYMMHSPALLSSIVASEAQNILDEARTFRHPPKPAPPSTQETCKGDAPSQNLPFAPAAFATPGGTNERPGPCTRGKAARPRRWRRKFRSHSQKTRARAPPVRLARGQIRNAD